jgi:hypothetical protein
MEWARRAGGTAPGKGGVVGVDATSTVAAGSCVGTPGLQQPGFAEVGRLHTAMLSVENTNLLPSLPLPASQPRPGRCLGARADPDDSAQHASSGPCPCLLTSGRCGNRGRCENSIAPGWSWCTQRQKQFCPLLLTNPLLVLCHTTAPHHPALADCPLYCPVLVLRRAPHTIKP